MEENTNTPQQPAEQPVPPQQPPVAPQQPPVEQPTYTANQQPVPPQQPYVANQPPYAAQQPYGVPQQPVASGNQKLFSILSYLGILWLFGLLINPDKYDPRVRFHVGQGIILTIANVVLSVADTILTAIVHAVFRSEVTMFGMGTGVYQTSVVGTILNTIIGLAVAVCSIGLMVYGIVQVCTNQDKPLPVIGKWAFYK